MISTTTQKEELLRRAEQYHHSIRCDMRTNEYVETVQVPCETRGYKKELEPIVPHDPYRIGPAWLTMNSYNALILNSPNMLIADIDRGDPRLNKFASFTEESNAIGSFRSLEDFDRIHDSQMRRESWRIYRTHSGWRAICTSRTFEPDWWAEEVLRFVRCDPRYMKLCTEQKCFRARLTPKPWRISIANHVCSLIEVTGDEVLPELADQIRLHDELTLTGLSGSTLA